MGCLKIFWVNGKKARRDGRTYRHTDIQTYGLPLVVLRAALQQKLLRARTCKKVKPELLSLGPKPKKQRCIFYWLSEWVQDKVFFGLCINFLTLTWAFYFCCRCDQMPLRNQITCFGRNLYKKTPYCEYKSWYNMFFIHIYIISDYSLYRYSPWYLVQLYSTKHNG